MTDIGLPIESVDNELVIDLPHLELVTSQFGTHGVKLEGTPVTDERLGLALCTVANLTGPKAVDVDGLLTGLRNDFAGQYGQWAPLMDANRRVAAVIGMPQPKSQSLQDDPQPATPPLAVPFTLAGRGVRVGMLDTKIDAHPDLIGRLLTEPDSRYQPLPEPVCPRAGHATFVASLITRMAPAVTLEARAVLDDDGRATAWETAQHMMDFADSGVDILNLSLGCRTTDGLPPLLMSRAVGLLSQRMVIVAAGGNNGAAEQPALRNAPIWPAALPDVVAVGARDIGALGIGEGLAKFSPQLPWVTCTAPGVNLTGAFLKATVLMKTGQSLPFDGYATWSGTSFATAMVSGAIAAATVPGKVTAHEALHGLLSESGGVVRPYVK